MLILPSFYIIYTYSHIWKYLESGVLMHEFGGYLIFVHITMKTHRDVKEEMQQQKMLSLMDHFG